MDKRERAIEKKRWCFVHSTNDNTWFLIFCPLFLLLRFSTHFFRPLLLISSQFIFMIFCTRPTHTVDGCNAKHRINLRQFFFFFFCRYRHPLPHIFLILTLSVFFHYLFARQNEALYSDNLIGSRAREKINEWEKFREIYKPYAKW